MGIPSDVLGRHVEAVAVVCTMSGCGLTVGLLLSAAPLRRLVAVPVLATPIGAAGALVWMLTRVALRLPVGMAPAQVIGAAVVAFIIAAVIGAFPPGTTRPDALKRGSKILPPLRTWRRPRAGDLNLAGHPVPCADEAKHFKVIGTTGTGKTTAIRELLAGALGRGDCAVIADPDGAYAEAFHDPARGDRILNPFDRRSCQWDLFAELSNTADADHLARSLISDQAGEERTWRSYARIYVAAVLRQARRAGVRELGTLHRLIAHAPTDELSRLLEATAAAPYLTAENARFFASVRAIASTQLAALEHIEQTAEGQPLAVRAWVRSRVAGQPSVLFLPYRANQIATLRGLISTWLRLAIFETMDAGADDRRMWFVVDELDALGAIDGLKDALARLRKFGGRCVLGFQSIAQVTGTYGSHDAQTIIENCGTTLLLRCSSSGNDGTSQFASKLIGDREVMREQVTRSRRGPAGSGNPARTRVLQQVTERAILPSEIEQLPDLAGYLKFASAPGWRRVELRCRRP